MSFLEQAGSSEEQYRHPRPPPLRGWRVQMTIEPRGSWSSYSGTTWRLSPEFATVEEAQQWEQWELAKWDDRAFALTVSYQMVLEEVPQQ